MTVCPLILTASSVPTPLVIVTSQQSLRLGTTPLEPNGSDFHVHFVSRSNPELTQTLRWTPGRPQSDLLPAHIDHKSFIAEDFGASRHGRRFGLCYQIIRFIHDILPNMSSSDSGKPSAPPPPADFFAQPRNPRHRRYEILRAFYHERLSAKAVARRFDCSVAAVYSVTRDFRKLIDPASFFFLPPSPPGRPPRKPPSGLREHVIELRRRNLSVPEIKARLDASSPDTLGERAIGRVLLEAGFPRLPRRTRAARSVVAAAAIRDPESAPLAPRSKEVFQCECAGGLLCLLPWIRRYGLDGAIEEAGYPGSRSLPPLQSVLAVLALKLAHPRRYSSDDVWCRNRGIGLFAGLNVLPKTAWFSSYSNRTTKAMNQRLLAALARIWTNQSLVGDSANLDFTSLPHWGRDATLENHWSDTQNRSLVHIPAALAQDPDSGLLLRTDATIRRQASARSVLEFLDLSHCGGLQLRFLVFDSRFTTYASLASLNQSGIRFVTVRRRGHKLVAGARAIPAAQRQQIRVPLQQGTRLVEVAEAAVSLRGYGGELRQITLLRGTRHPSLLLTNDFDASLSAILRRYARRWLVDKSVSEQLGFFHLNRLSSSMVIKVDFDLALTVLAYNLYRLLALDLPSGYRRCSALTLFETMLATGADIRLDPDLCTVSLKNQSGLPALLAGVAKIQPEPIPWLGNRRLAFNDATGS